MRLFLLAGALVCSAALACSDPDETLADETVADETEADETEADDTEADDTEAADDTDEEASDDATDEGDVPTDDGDEPSAGDAGAGDPFPVECTLDQENPEDPEGFMITFTDETVECGSAMCQGVTIEGFVGTSGCCADEEASACGLDMSTLGLLLNLQNPGCEELDRPGSCDPACGPSTPIELTALGAGDAPAEGIQLPGCCQADGTCGFQANFGGFGFGCVSADRFAGQESDGPCDYSP